MRVLMLTWEYPPIQVGGLGRHVAGLSQALADRGHEVHILTRGDEADEKVGRIWVHRAHPYDMDSMNFATWVMQMNFSMLERAMAFGRKHSPFDILHAHDWLVAFAGRALKHAWQVPLVATIHATEAGRNSGLHNDLQRYISSVEWWLGYEAWRVIVCSQHMRDEVRNLFNLPDDKVKVIPNAVDLKPPVEVEPGFREFYAHPNEKIVFFVGRMVREKGVQVLLDAAPMVLKAFPEAKFIIAGTGPLRQSLQEQANALGLGPKVYLTGFIDDDTLAKLYQCASVSVFPSLYEPFGIVALEAMAAGVPLVVSDCGGLGEIVRHNETGLKALPGNAFSLANQIQWLLRHPERAAEIAQNGRETVRRLYNWPSVANLTAQVYHDVRRAYLHSDWGRKPGTLLRRLENRPSVIAPRTNPFARRASLISSREDLRGRESGS